MGFFENLTFFKKLVGRKIFGEKGPLSVIFNVTNRCNCKCKYCYASFYNRDITEGMSVEQIKKLILDLHKNGCQRISFSGGEPLLQKDIGEIVDYANSLGMNTALNSNGILVPKYLEVLKKVGTLAISLDGRPEHHDIFRGKGTADKAIEGVIKAVEAGINVHTNTVIHKYNLDDIDYIVDLAKQHGFKAEFNLAISNVFGNGVSPGEIKPSSDEFIQAIKHIIRKKEEGAPILFSAQAYRSVLNCWKDFSIEKVLNDSPPDGMPDCPAGKFFCLIDTDGTLWACPLLVGKIEAKNALETGVAEAWRTAQKHPCTGCYMVCHHEFSLLMNLNSKLLWNYFKIATGKN